MGGSFSYGNFLYKLPKMGYHIHRNTVAGRFGDRMREKISNFIKKAVVFLLNPRFVLCFGIGWMITNGWSYILLGLGSWMKIGWMVAVAGAYLTVLWLPISPEKIVTIAIAMWLMKVLFPDDTKTLGVLREMYAKLKDAVAVKRSERQKKKEQKDH